MPENKSLIKAEEASQVRQWTLPEFGAKREKRIASAEKEAREQALRKQQAEKEVVEDITPPSAPNAQEIEAIRAEAEAAGFNEGKQAGFDQGLAEGREQGMSQALVEYRPQMDAQLQQLQSILAGLTPPLEQQRLAIQRQICVLVQKLTRHLVQAELATPSEHIENLVASCVAALPVVKHPTRVYVHPDDLAYLKGEVIITEQLHDVELVADANLSPGGCIAERGASLIDASTESLLDDVLSQFTLGTEPMEASENASSPIQPAGPQGDTDALE